MSKKFSFTPERLKEYERILTRYDDVESALLPALHLAQEQNGHCSPELVEYLSELMKIPTVRINEVISFYDMFYDKPTAKHIIHICTNISCSMSGGREIHKGVLKHFETENMRPTKDGKLFIQKMECLGFCEVAPVIRVGNEVRGGVTLDETIKILSELE